MKKFYILIPLLLFLISCDKYDFIDERTRFNKRSGEIELLTTKGEWIEKSKYLSEVQKIKDEVKQKETEKERIDKINEEKEQKKQLVKFPNSILNKLTGSGSFDISDLYDESDDGDIYSYYSRGGGFSCKIENNSNWKIEEIDILVKIYSSLDKKLLIEEKFTGKSYGDFQGQPYQKFTYSGLTRTLLENQFFKWSIIECRGYEVK